MKSTMKSLLRMFWIGSSIFAIGVGSTSCAVAQDGNSRDYMTMNIVEPVVVPWSRLMLTANGPDPYDSVSVSIEAISESSDREWPTVALSSISIQSEKAGINFLADEVLLAKIKYPDLRNTLVQMHPKSGDDWYVELTIYFSAKKALSSPGCMELDYIDSLDSVSIVKWASGEVEVDFVSSACR